MKAELLCELAPITDEEKRFLDGKGIDKSIYMCESGNTVNAKKLLDEGKLITVRPHTRFVHFPEHTHDYVELVYMCSGMTTHLVNGTKIMLGEGELLFLGQRARQEILPAGKDDIAVNFIILPEFFDSTIGLLGEEETPLRRFVTDCLCGGKSESNYLHFKVSDVLPIQNIIENLIWMLIHGSRSKRKINQNSMGLLFMHLLDYTERLEYENVENELVLRVLRYVESHYADGSLTELSDMMHYDFAWLSREIKRRTGKTYTELVQEKRLSQSVFLLKNTEMNVRDIAYSVGYDNLSYFHRLFKSEYGESPKKFRSCK